MHLVSNPMWTGHPKTSFVKAQHNVGQLREDITFNNDNLSSYEDYLEEVKPLKQNLENICQL